MEKNLHSQTSRIGLGVNSKSYDYQKYRKIIILMHMANNLLSYKQVGSTDFF